VTASTRLEKYSPGVEARAHRPFEGMASFKKKNMYNHYGLLSLFLPCAEGISGAFEGSRAHTIIILPPRAF